VFGSTSGGWCSSVHGILGPTRAEVADEARAHPTA
jgi:hypothetical protein